MRIGTRLRKLRTTARLSQAALAEKAGVSQQLVSQLERGENERTTELPALARALNVSVADIDPSYTDVASGERSVPIVGKAGAGPHGSVLFAETDGDFGEAQAPVNATAETKALEVEGTSMRGFAEDGSLIFYDERVPPDDTHVGELCICWLEDGRVLVKLPYHGTQPGLWNLESTTADTIRDVAVRWFAHVTGIVPRRAARALIRQRVDIQPVDTVVSP